MPKKDDVLSLLREAAELEHQLLVQYLFAAYSLKTEPDEFPGSPDPHATAQRNRGWRDRILVIAREEMGHLVTVQQVILSLGGRPHFDRDSFPINPFFYPFTFTLEPLTTGSLAKYLWTEKPREVGELTRDALLGPDRAAIETEVYGHQPNELGKLYMAILQGLELLPPDDFGAGLAHQTDLSRWPGLGREAIVTRVPDQAAAIKGVRRVVEQGEGHLSSKGPSHFQRFLELYREFSQAVAQGEEPSRNVATDPNTADPFEPGHDRSRREVLRPGRITAQPALRWAGLFNKRYAVLLANLTHALCLPVVAPGGQRIPSRAGCGEPLRDAEVKALKPEEFAKLPPERVASLAPEQVGHLPDEQVGAMTAPQIRALDADRLRALTSGQIRALSVAAVKALDPARIELLDTAALDTLIRDRRNDLLEPRQKAARLAKRRHEQLEALIRWSRDEMTLVIAPVARHLTHLPTSDADGAPRAGAPFELDSTGPTLPDDEKTRWCAHQRLIDETRLLISEFRRPGDDPLGLLSAVEAIDRARADFIARQIRRETSRSRKRARAAANKIAAEWKQSGKRDDG